MSKCPPRKYRDKSKDKQGTSASSEKPPKVASSVVTRLAHKERYSKDWKCLSFWCRTMPLGLLATTFMCKRSWKKVSLLNFWCVWSIFGASGQRHRQRVMMSSIGRPSKNKPLTKHFIIYGLENVRMWSSPFAIWQMLLLSRFALAEENQEMLTAQCESTQHFVFSDLQTEYGFENNMQNHF